MKAQYFLRHRANKELRKELSYVLDEYDILLADYEKCFAAYTELSQEREKKWLIQPATPPPN